jgi:hypothetical protein
MCSRVTSEWIRRCRCRMTHLKSEPLHAVPIWSRCHDSPHSTLENVSGCYVVYSSIRFHGQFPSHSQQQRFRVSLAIVLLMGWVGFHA